MAASLQKKLKTENLKQSEVKWNWHSKKVSREWRHISLACKKHLKACLYNFYKIKYY